MVLEQKCNKSNHGPLYMGVNSLRSIKKNDKFSNLKKHGIHTSQVINLLLKQIFAC